ncbi:MAG TPA: S41 family peptidase [Kiritimatiellia bacterium]|nr:S41 family peptidase [Kiritimatiellia bacterium]
MKHARLIRFLALALVTGPVASSPAEELADPAPVAETASAPVLHPLAHDVNDLLARLAAHGLALDAVADRAPLYECVARTFDPAARVFTAEAFARLRLEHAGQSCVPPFQLSVSNGLPVVVAVSGDEEAAVATGDRLLAIHGASATNLPLANVLRMLRGHGETNLNLLVLRANGATATVSVATALQPLPLLETRETWPRRIGYAQVNNLSTGAGDALLTLLREWADAGLAGGILDLRGAGGDELDGIAALAAPFASPGSLLFALRDRDENEVATHRAPAATAALDLPLMVLVDEWTRGAAEVYAAVATDSLRGVLVVGRATAGDPAIRTPVDLPGGLVLYVATRRLVTGNGLTLDGASGVTPNLVVAARAPRVEYEPTPGAGLDHRQTLDEEAEDRALRDRMRGDPALQRATDVLLGLKALNIRAKTASGE